MWDRVDLKERAKGILKTTYWMSFLASLIFSAVCGGVGGGINFSSGRGSSASISDSFSGMSPSAVIAALVIVFFVMIFALVVGFAVQAFLTNPITVGHNKFYMQAAYNDVSIDNMLYAFKNSYMNIVKSMFFVSLYTALWSFLFVIPGIVKSYEYAMIPYILAENPNIDTNRAFEISKNATYGHKMNMFILDLSFIGWFLLGTLCCCMGTLFVNPYFFATKTQLYFALKENALRSGFASEADFMNY